MRSEEAQAGVCANGEKGGSPVRDGRLQRSRILVAPHEDAVGVDVWRPLHNTSSAALLSAFGLGRVPYRPQPQCLASEAFYKVSYEKLTFFVSRALFQRSQEWGKGTLHKSSRRRRCRIFHRYDSAPDGADIFGGHDLSPRLRDLRSLCRGLPRWWHAVPPRPYGAPRQLVVSSQQLAVSN